MTTVTREHLAGLELAKNNLSQVNAEILDGLIAQASAAPEQEAALTPAAYRTIDEFGSCTLSIGKIHRDSRALVLADHAERLISFGRYETERLRAELAEWSPSMQRLSDQNQELRQRLAEAQALLQGGVLVGRSELSIVRAALKRDAEERGMPVRAEILADLDSSIERFDTLLSATAQPADTGCSACACGSTEPHAATLGCIKAAGDAYCSKNTHVGQPAEVKS